MARDPSGLTGHRATRPELLSSMIAIGDPGHGVGYNRDEPEVLRSGKFVDESADMAEGFFRLERDVP